MTLADEKFVLFTTFRRDGRAVGTPVWIVGLEDGRLGFITGSSSGKAKRLRAGSGVQLQPCDRRGRPTPGTAPVTATARIAEGAELADVRRRIAAKYPVGVKLIGAVRAVLSRLGRNMPEGDCAIVIDAGAGAPVSPRR